MAFGFPPKFISTLQLGDLNAKQFMALAAKTAAELGWTVGGLGDNELTATTPFSMSSWSEKVTITVYGDYAEIKSECTGTQAVDWGKNKKNVTRFIDQFETLRTTTDKESLAQHSEDAETADAAAAPGTGSEAPAAKKKISFFSLFIPREGYYVTPIIVDLNIAVYVLMVISGVNFFLPDKASMLAWGANLRPLTLDGEWWRLLTCCFLHFGIIHLLFNMYALLYVGLLLEPYLGKLRFATAYILTGLVASTTSLWVHDLTISAGASGAIFGMYGVFLAMLTTNLIDKKTRMPLLSSIGVFVVYNLIYGAKSGVDNAAHIGGLVSGLVIGYAYYPSLRWTDRPGLELQITTALSVFIIFCCTMICRSIPNDIVKYEEQMKTFDAIEHKALFVYSMPKNSPSDSLLAEIKNHGLVYWNQDIALVDSVEKLNLPDEIRQRNQKLLRYCDLRIKTYNLIYKSIAANTEKYKDSIDDYNRDIGNIIDSLKGDK